MNQDNNHAPEVTRKDVETCHLSVFVVSSNLAPASLKTMVGLANKYKWKYKVLGRALYPDQPLYFQGWILVPADQDASDIPDGAMDKVRKIYANGLCPKGFLLAHEQDPAKDNGRPDGVMSAPSPEWFQKGIAKPQRVLNMDLEAIGESVKPIVRGIGKALTIIASLALGILSIAVPIASALGEAILLDPVLIVVTADDYWIEIDRWYD